MNMRTASGQAPNADPLVIARTDEGFRVYRVSDPSKSHFVSGSLEAPNCTCPEFQHHEGSLAWYCHHIRAVVDQITGVRSNGMQPADEEVAERLAIAEEGSKVNQVIGPQSSNNLSQMNIKRSVSPDGRIDSLSVEFTSAVGSISSREIKSRAAATLRLQADIVDSFLKGEKSERPSGDTDGDPYGPTPAIMLGVGGSDGRWGRRLFIILQSNGNSLRLYGTQKQLNHHLENAGFANVAIREGMTLNLPCRITTKRSDDGRWLNVEQVLPSVSAALARRAA